ncbi:MAG: UDP-glucose 4-epimerase GalE [Bacteroidales bacterium]|nr:UDP-glucose 4-epimerase GalE [Bacteroidales bacterium]
MKILVTGGTGYIGSHTAVELQEAGFEVIIADNLSNSEAGVIDRIAEITGTRPAFEVVDLTDVDATGKLFLKYPGIIAVIHFAALKSVSESVERPLAYYQNNIVSLLNLIREMECQHIPHLVFSSSCTVYGQPEKLPVTEDAPFRTPWSPYGNTKQVSEQIIRDVCRVSSFNSILLRYFNPAGAHHTALIGELPLGVPNNLVPYITQTAAGKRDYLRIFGNDYNTPDGTAIRDYIHVVDLAKAHVAALTRLVERKNTQQAEAFNLGTGKGYSVMEVVQSFERVSGVRLNYRYVPRRPGDVEQVWADPSLANRELAWKAEQDLDEMLRSAWNWEKRLMER